MYKEYFDDYTGVRDIPSILKWINKGTRVLEFGPANGYMTRYMKESLDCRVTCVELSPEMAARTSVYAEKMVVANLDTDPWAEQLDGVYDYIMFGDVLEHLRDPQAVLSRASAFLAPGGSVLTSIPNIGHAAVIMSLLDGEFEYQQYGLLDSTHIHFFTRKSIGEMMSACGLHCAEEKNTYSLPIDINLGKSYCGHFFRYLFLIWRKDIHVTQFIHRWQKEPVDVVVSPIRLSLRQMLLAYADELNEWFYRKKGKRLQLPSLLKKLVR